MPNRQRALHSFIFSGGCAGLGCTGTAGDVGGSLCESGASPECQHRWTRGR